MERCVVKKLPNRRIVKRWKQKKRDKRGKTGKRRKKKRKNAIMRNSDKNK